MASVDPQNETERHRSDLYTRPGWVDAVIALGQLDEVGLWSSSPWLVQICANHVRFGSRESQKSCPRRIRCDRSFGGRPDRGIVGDVPCYASLGWTTRIASCVVHS